VRAGRGDVPRSADQVREHQMLCPYSFRHRAQIGSRALAVKVVGTNSAAAVGSLDGMDGEMDDEGCRARV
jgi:hypothetical protein